MRVVLIDELDALITKKQTLLYNLFDWPCNQNSRLLVIAIANTMDLPERLQSKISSRIGNNRLVYEPYNVNQIQEILLSRLKGIDIFDHKAIMLVAQKVSSYSGDIRRSLQIARRAVELTRDAYFKNKEAGKKSNELQKVTYSDILKAFDELYNSKTVMVLKTLRKFEILIIIAIYLELNAQKVEKVLFDKVQDRCDNMLKVLDWKEKNIPSAVYRESVKRLHCFGLINMIVESNKLVENVHL